MKKKKSKFSIITNISIWLMIIVTLLGVILSVVLQFVEF
ncbi:MAG: DUF4044 domain-containing protein [Bombilactobacillus mellifer]|nr:DUF4044 domain-containing protein [Bombilactobacillus mellifer]